MHEGCRHIAPLRQGDAPGLAQPGDISGIYKIERAVAAEIVTASPHKPVFRGGVLHHRRINTTVFVQ